MPDSRLGVVVSCTDRKRLPAPDDLQLRSYDADLPTRAAAWIGRLEHPATEQVRAATLYKGEHWKVVEELSEVATAVQHGLQLSIASAGYGLLHPDELVEPYAATFATREIDSVTRREGSNEPASDARYWWHRLADRTRPPGLPATLTELAEQDPDAPLVVALSGAYVRAVADDLVSAADALKDRGRLFLVSGGTSDTRLDPFRVPLDARFQGALGGTMLSLNVRVTRHLIERTHDHGWDRGIVHRLLDAELRALPDRIRYDRASLSDEQVISFIEENLESHAAPSRSTLLRRLRDENLACEQKRFGRLYETVLEGAQS